MPETSGNYSIIVAIISFVGSIAAVVIGGFVSYVVARKTTKDEIRKVRSKFVEKLYEKRMELYPQLWQISDEIYGPKKKHKPPEEIVKRNQDGCLDKLRKWKRNSGGYMFFSKKSEKAFGELESRLSKNPEKKNEYSEVQLENIENARIDFCKALKEDIGIFDDAEKEIKKLAK